MMTAPHELRTARLLLRSLEPGDVPAIVRLAGAHEIAATTAKIPHPYTKDDAQTFLAHAGEDFCSGLCFTFAVSLLATGELCGAVGLTLAGATKMAELGYWIGLPFWGRGFATEAASAVVTFGFEELHLRRIYAFHFAGNLASKRVLEKIGMSHEGRSRRRVWKWDRFIDLESYGLLEGEFRRGKQTRNGANSPE